ncbi:RNA polymerase sigma factor [Aquisalimonas sp. 2447]|uniref:RNA polymerase sigma factor n=1 Tax=Aquisalimonas sp. 2447 TaxID=2740807 RepID=UPI0014325215|nr:RNA polymerase sigma factor [Aquisalimonas sp. 2447]QIT56712.1 RNA polymerase sigma factor [Aquisalimonas sp. 2447]
MSQLAHLWKRLSARSAFEAALAPHMDRLWRLALRFQGNSSDAEDLLQELVSRAWDKRATILELDAPGPWLAKVLYRLHVDRWRRQGAFDHAESLDEALQIEAASQTEAALERVSVDEILAEVERLPEHQRAVLLLHDGEGYRLEEIATMVEAPVGTLKSRLHRARAAVRRSFAEDGTKSDAAACSGGKEG